MDHVVAYLRVGLVVFVASRRLKIDPRRAGEASTAASGLSLSAGKRDEEGVGER
jgi:hypothetical protein